MPAKASRAAFGEALVELGAANERIVTVDADLSKSTMTAKFAKTYPARAFNVGIAESGMIGLAAGLALAGRIPFACSFACFVVGRFETIRVSVCECPRCGRDGTVDVAFWGASPTAALAFVTYPGAALPAFERLCKNSTPS